MKHNYYILLFFFFWSCFAWAQKNDCEYITSFLNQKETQIVHLNLYDPDYIPLHYMVAKDIIKELKKFRNDVIPNYSTCKTITFSELINRYENLVNNVQLKYDSLTWLNENVYFIFYEKALNEYQFNNEEEGRYFLDRSLQYNAIFSNAILLKLNKLLDKSCFQECLSLLNTLYYETEMDAEQEKQAIAFTDNFYDKLYKTGDSLLKIDHAAEALQLFEVLETFCQNLPTNYCNDDYYHGVLNSKTGIYDSYTAIAKVAEEKENQHIAARFYQYAQEYLDNNPHLKTYEPKMEWRIENGEWRIENGEREKAESRKQKVEGRIEARHAELVSASQGIAGQARNDEGVPEGRGSLDVIQKMEEDIEEDIVEEVYAETQTLAPPPSSVELKEKYDKMVLQALALCIKEEFTASYNMFVEAKKLEDCRCFDTDFRVDLMIRELSNIGIK